VATPPVPSNRPEELPGAVGFTVLVPERALDDAEVDVMIEPAVPRHGVPEYADITYHKLRVELSVRMPEGRSLVTPDQAGSVLWRDELELDE
jgi:hypothetical protein